MHHKLAGKQIVCSFIVLSLFSFISPRNAFADFRLSDAIQEFGEKRFVKTRPTRLKTGPIRYYPSIRTKVTYDDNVFLQDIDPSDDIIFNIQPGVILELPINTHQIAVGYEADIEVFTKSRHAKQSDQNQNLFVLMDFKFPQWYINILDKFSETSGRAGTTFLNRIPRYDHTIHPKIGYRWKRMTFEAGFRHFTRDFRQDVNDALDFQFVEWTGVLFFDLFARLKALLQGQVGQIDYDDNFQRNGTFTEIGVGLDGELMPNLEVDGKVGMHFRNYETNSKPDFNSWVARLSMNYKLRENMRFKLSFERVPLEATLGNVNFLKRHIVRAGMEYDLGTKWTVFQSMKYYRDFYTERILIGLNRFGFRRDDHFSYTTGLRYAPQEWLEFELAYEFFRRDSNFATFDYTDNRISLASTLSY